MWLQRLDRLYLLHRIEKKCFKVYKLSGSQRNKCTYDKENYHESTFTDLGNFYNVAVRDLTLTCETDGFDEALLLTQLQHTSNCYSLQQIIDLNKRLQHYVRRNAWTAPKTKWNILVSEQIMKQLPNDDKGEFLSMIEALPPALRRNVGAIQDIQGLNHLATSIELEKKSRCY